MEADAVVRPALIREWRRRDGVLAERLTRMLNEFVRPDADRNGRGRSRRMAV